MFKLLEMFKLLDKKTTFPDGITSISIYFIIRFGNNIAISGKKVMMKRMMTIGI
jgi:hypothetical protein